MLETRIYKEKEYPGC